MDANNPLMIPVIGSFYITNLPMFEPSKISESTELVLTRIKSGKVMEKINYWNPLVTQEDIHRAMAYPLASAGCALSDIQSVIPGLTVINGTNVPRWSTKTYIEGWTLGTDLLPYFTRVCYLWTGDHESKQQTIFIGLGTNGKNTYMQRTDTCLNMIGTVQPYYEWQVHTNVWCPTKCLEDNPPVGLPKPDWLEQDRGMIIVQIRGNPNFGLATNEAINIIAAQLPRGRGELAIFWLWFLEDGRGMLFSEGNYMNPLSHNLQLIDYTMFVQDADITQSDFYNPCSVLGATEESKLTFVHGHSTRVSRLD